MNPYSNTALPFLSEVTLSIPNLPSSPSVPSPPHYSPPTPSDRSEPLHSNDPTVTVHNQTSAPSESISPHNNPDQTLQSDSSNPYPPDSGQISIISDSFSAQIPDLECSICFSQFNNAFRCPKMLQCKHTFCLECLARMNVKSTEPSAILCPLCRGLTPLPTLGLPKLDTDPEVLSCLPAAMQRVYSVRFVRNKGRLQLKRVDDLSALTQSTRRSLDVGLPSPIATAGVGGASGGVGGALFRLTGRPACRAILLIAIIMMIVLLTTVIVFILSKVKQ